MGVKLDDIIEEMTEDEKKCLSNREEWVGGVQAKLRLEVIHFSYYITGVTSGLGYKFSEMN